MALRADKVSQPHTAVLRDTFGPRGLNDYDDGISNRSRFRFNIGDFGLPVDLPGARTFVITPQMLVEAVEALREIVEEKSDRSMGFHPLPLDEDDVNYGRKATELADYLSGCLSSKRFSRINPNKFMEAISVVETHKFITVLEGIAKKKGSYLGFRDTRTERDKEIAARASRFASELKQNQYEETVAKALEFIESVTEDEILKNSKTHRSRIIFADPLDPDEIFSTN